MVNYGEYYFNSTLVVYPNMVLIDCHSGYLEAKPLPEFGLLQVTRRSWSQKYVQTYDRR